MADLPKSQNQFLLPRLWNWKSIWIISQFQVSKNIFFVCNLDFRFLKTDLQFRNPDSEKLYLVFGLGDRLIDPLDH